MALSLNLLMKMIVVFGIFLHVSQHALAGVVEVNKGEEFVLLPCLYKDQIPDFNPSVIWTQNNLNPKLVHLRRDEEDNLKDQNQVYRGRTSMRPDVLDTGNFSLTLRKPKLSDTGEYTCSIGDRIEEVKVTEVQLKVKDQHMEVNVNEGAESVILPCRTTANLPEDATVEWTRSGPEIIFVHVYTNTKNDDNKQSKFCNSRTEMNKDLTRTGDLSLTLKYPSDRDSGDYICTIYRDKDILRQKVVLKHFKEEKFPAWSIALLVFLFLGLLVSGGVLFYFRWYFMSVYKVEVDSGDKSVLLPCRTTVNMHKDVKVEWTDDKNRKVHVFKDDSKKHEEQDQFYTDRTKMNKILLKTGDLSLTLKHPTEGDGGTFACTIYSSDGNILMKKLVNLVVKVYKVEVDSGDKSVLLPCRTTVSLPKDVKVEWTDDKNRKVHVFEDDSKKPEEQDQFYKNRTKMNKDLLRSGDLSLTLKHPTDRDSGTFICTVYSNDGDLLKTKQVQLEVKVYKVEVDSGDKYVLLPCRTRGNLREDVKVEWTDHRDEKVHVFENGFSQPEEQDIFYQNRTKMNEDLLRIGDLSLTLKQPTERDSGAFTCTVYSNEGNILKTKKVQLEVKACQVEVEKGVESVLLPYRTSKLPEEAEVEWMDSKYRKVHVFEKGSDQPDKQNQIYRNRTKMNEDLLRTGDLSLTLKHPTEWDSGTFSCSIFGSDGNILRSKEVQLEVKGGVQDPEVISLLTADQSV